MREQTKIENSWKWATDSWGSATCLICDILDNEPWVPFRTMFSMSEVSSETIIDSDNFQVIADIGPITEGHCLINAKTHIPSLAYLSKPELEELIMIKEKTRNIVKELYQKPIFFEHGALDFAHNAGCCIDHAHLHIVPSQIDILPLIARDFTFRSVGVYTDIMEMAAGKEYLFYQNQTGDMFLATVSRVPSQYFRRVLASTYGNKVPWNWRDHVRFANALGTKHKILRLRCGFLEKLANTNSVAIPGNNRE